MSRINLDFAKVIAPIDGRIGRRILGVGNLVRADETTLATIVNTNPTFVNFDIDERTLRTLLRAGEAAKDGKRTEFAVAIELADETGFPRQAKLDFVDNTVDAAKGTVQVRAVLLDADKQLRPGMYCRVRLTTGEPRHALLVPEIAIWRGNNLLVVNDKNAVEVRIVKLGQGGFGDMRVVTRGLKAGERVQRSMLGGHRQRVCRCSPWKWFPPRGGHRRRPATRIHEDTLLRIVLTWLFGLLFAAAGLNHFVNTDFYVGIMPPQLPWHRELVYISGAIEVLLGVLLLMPRYRRIAAWGLVALLVAVFPANLHMALHPDLFPAFSPGRAVGTRRPAGAARRLGLLAHPAIRAMTRDSVFGRVATADGRQAIYGLHASQSTWASRSDA